ncbi:MerR family transcriptional regulator [Rhodococcus sp. NPDC060176]|uniref:MerR family transcriptional regulator n=1 Tax=Rhodococcus sp. NPDC060176 TaxID=3347062 RepID=UPI00365DC2E6
MIVGGKQDFAGDRLSCIPADPNRGFRFAVRRCWRASNVATVTPARTSGETRHYSAADLDQLRRIITFIGGGINLTGIGAILSLETENAILVARISQLCKTAGDAPSEVTPEAV